MAKTIKFNLVCDGYQVRTLEDLRNHFSIEDILQYYRDKVLEKWLAVRSFTEELEAVKLIQSDSDLEIIERLVSIFNVEIDKERIEYATSIIRYRETREECVRQQKEKDIEVSTLYDQYLGGYEKLKADIKENPRNKSIIQAAIDQIVSHYAVIFSMDYRNFFYEIRSISPLAIICLLMNPSTRKYYIIEDEKNTQDGEDSAEQNLPDDLKSYCEQCNKDKTEMYQWIKDAVNSDEFLEGLGHYLIKKNNDTGLRFVHLTKDKCLVLKLDHVYISDKIAITSPTDPENILSTEDVNGRFLIIDGLEYQSENSANSLYYIEI